MHTLEWIRKDEEDDSKNLIIHGDNLLALMIMSNIIFDLIKKPELLGMPNGIDPNVDEKSKIFKPESCNTVVKE